jgi:autotransporter-associated beta strand protein
MNLGIRFPLLLITILSVGVWSYSQAVAQIVEEDYPDAHTVAEDAAPFSAATSTVYTWSTSTTGFAWLNATHWTGNPGHYPGVDTNIKSIADGASNDIAAFSAMAFASTNVGINFSFSYNNGVSDNSGANGSLTLGAIDYLSTTNKSISIGDDSGTAGTLTLTGATLNSVANTVLANEGANSLTLAPQIGGGTQDMTLALGNATNNVVQVNGTGRITITTAIQNAAGVAARLTKIGPGRLTLSHPNTYTGVTTINKGLLIVTNTTGSATGTGRVQVNAATLGGSGRISGAVAVGTATAGGVLAPGFGTTPGTLTLSNSVTFNSASSYKVDANSTTAKVDKVVARGVTINSGAQFFFADHGSGTFAPGTVFTLISNTDTTAIAGTFGNLSEGLTFSIGANTYRASYHGGEGNDLTLTVQ